MKTRIERKDVCDSCYCSGHPGYDCICTYDKYTTIKLDFEVCDCCGRGDDGQPADTEFNQQQFKSQNS